MLFWQEGAHRLWIVAWGLSQAIVIAPWRKLGLTTMFQSVRRSHQKREDYQVPPMSGEWLHWQELDSYKHRDM